jgi:hypothetical protein
MRRPAQLEKALNTECFCAMLKNKFIRSYIRNEYLLNRKWHGHTSSKIYTSIATGFALSVPAVLLIDILIFEIFNINVYCIKNLPRGGGALFLWAACSVYVFFHAEDFSSEPPLQSKEKAVLERLLVYCLILLLIYYTVVHLPKCNN